MSKIDELNRVTGLMFNSYNILNQLKYKFTFKGKRVILKNKELKSSKNEICYIIGNGPSVKNFDFSLLNGYDTFTMNFFFENKLSETFQPTYHIMIDGVFYSDKYLNYVKTLYEKKENTKFIFSYKGYNTLESKKELMNRAFYIKMGLIQHDNYLKIDMSKNTTACVNVALAALQCAMYMGYKKIYLIGCEFNSYATLKPTHFYDEKKEDRTVPMGVDLQWSSLAHYHHYAINKYAEKNHIEIFNATPGSLIDAYKRIDLT